MERQHGFTINTLTVIANESYEQFAESLQKKYENDGGIRFGIIEEHLFAYIPVKQADGSTTYLGQAASDLIYNHFTDNEYIDKTGKVQDKLKTEIKNNDVSVPVKYEPIKPALTALAKNVSGNLNIKNNSDKKKIRLNKQVYLNPEFKELDDFNKFIEKDSIS